VRIDTAGISPKPSSTPATRSLSPPATSARSPTSWTRIPIALSSEPPAFLLLDNDALAIVGDTLDAHRHEIDAWRDLSRSTDRAS